MSAVSGAGVEETADSALSLILQLYRRTYWLAAQLMRGAEAGSARRSLTPEQLRELPAAASITTIRGEQLGLVGLGMPLPLPLPLSLSLTLQGPSPAPAPTALACHMPRLLFFRPFWCSARAPPPLECAHASHECLVPETSARLMLMPLLPPPPPPPPIEAEAEAHGACGARRGVAWHRHRHRVERLWAPQEIGNLICLMHPSGRYAYFIIPRARRLLYYLSVWEIV